MRRRQRRSRQWSLPVSWARIVGDCLMMDGGVVEAFPKLLVVITKRGGYLVLSALMLRLI